MHAFDARDGTFSVIADGGYKMSPSAHAILWFLLFHGIYDPGSRWYTYVDIRVCGQDVIATAIGRHRASVVRGLAELEKVGFIQRHKRYNTDTGNRMCDGIQLTCPDDFCRECRTRDHREDACPVSQNPS